MACVSAFGACLGAGLGSDLTTAGTTPCPKSKEGGEAGRLWFPLPRTLHQRTPPRMRVLRATRPTPVRYRGGLFARGRAMRLSRASRASPREDGLRDVREMDSRMMAGGVEDGVTAGFAGSALGVTISEGVGANEGPGGIGAAV